MPTTLELEAPVEQQSAPASTAMNPAETTVPSPSQKRAKKRPGRKRAHAKSASAKHPHEYTSPVAVLVTNPSPETEATVAEAAHQRIRTKKPVRMGQALRKEGIDEYAVAETWAEVVGMLKGKTEENEDVDKLLVDVLKECSKHLEDDNKAAGPPPVRVKLIHNVARPQRNTAPPASASEPATKDPAAGT